MKKQRDFYQPISPGGGNYAITGPLGQMVAPEGGGPAYHSTHHSRGHARDQRFLSAYRLGRDAHRSKYNTHQGAREIERRTKRKGFAGTGGE